jgi:hypothetical protein
LFGISLKALGQLRLGTPDAIQFIEGDVQSMRIVTDASGINEGKPDRRKRLDYMRQVLLILIRQRGS